jgi:predicted 3-demethylubiquinone-9 3-methyltransferase (glyoxalase superfamily)
MSKITPCLWFNGQAEEAANLYTSVFKNSKIIRAQRNDKASAVATGMPEGSVLVVEFELEGQKFLGLNGGPAFKFSEAVSFSVDCKDQEEVDYFWTKFTSDGGAESQCGWLKDKYGLSWQIIPKQLNELMSDPDKAKAGRVMRAMLKMKKIIVSDLEKAAAGE